MACTTLEANIHRVNFVDLDPREDYVEEILVSTEDLKDVKIGPLSFQTIKVGTFLTRGEGRDYTTIPGKCRFVRLVSLRHVMN